MSLRDSTLANPKNFENPKVNDLEINGTVTNNGGPIFYVDLASNQSLSTASSFIDVQFNTPIVNIGSAFVPGSYHFVAPVTGLYEFTVSLAFSGINANMALTEVNFQGSVLKRVWEGNLGAMLGTGNFYVINAKIQQKLTAAQTAKIQVKSSGTISAWVCDVSGSYFAGKLITKI